MRSRIPFLVIAVFCRSYPHGGRASAFLLVSMACATVCTCYSVSTCRFATLEFQSEYGDFDLHFYASDREDSLSTYAVNVGLFTWLRPFDTLEWTEGSCSGYNELQREIIVDGNHNGAVATSTDQTLFKIATYILVFLTNNLKAYAYGFFFESE